MSREIEKVSIPYGNKIVDVEFPSKNLLSVASPKEIIPQVDIATLVRQAVRAPINMRPFSNLLKGGEHLLIIVDDLTRSTPVDKILPILLEEMGTPKKKIDVTVLIALGTHRMMTALEIKQKVGPEIYESYRVINHEWDNEEKLLDLGVTTNGTPIKINRLLQEADICIGIGNLAPHNQAGWSGGGKIVVPGISGKETTYHIHLLAARSPRSVLGKLINPVRVEIEQIVHQTRLSGVINTVLDLHDRVIHVVAGESFSAYRRGVELARPIWEVPVPGLADIVLVSSYPADIDYWQANKALYAAERIVKRGGDIILVTPCPERLSAQQEHVHTLVELAGYPSRQLFHIMQEKKLEDYAALSVSTITAYCKELAWVTVVSDGLTNSDVNILGLDNANSVEEALEIGFRRQGKNASIIVLTHGGKIVPVLSR